MQLRVLESLRKAATENRSRTGNPFDPYDKPDDAGRASQLLRTMESLSSNIGRELDDESREELGLALWRGADDKESIRDRAARLLASCRLSDDVSTVPYLLARAESQPRNFEGWKTRFLLYDEIFHFLEKNEKGNLQDRYERVLMLALDSGKRAEKSPEADMDLKQRVGRTFYAKAKFVDKYMGMVEDWRRERMEAGEEATKRWVDSDALMELCAWHRDWASRCDAKSVRQKEYLGKAAEDAQRAASVIGDGKKKSEAFHVAGAIHEELATTFLEKEQYTAAIAELTNAIKHDSQNGLFLADRGRCWFKLSQSESGAAVGPALENAKKDLHGAIETSPKDQQSEALCWLAMAYSKQEKPDLGMAKDCLVQAFEAADSKNMAPEFYSNAFTALLNVGELLYWDALEFEATGGVKRIRDTDKLALAAQCFHQFGKFIQKTNLADYSKIRSEVPQFRIPSGVDKDDFAIYANGRLRDLADGYWFDPAKKDMDKVLEIASLGIPTKVADATHYHIYCLNRRNILYGTQMAKLSSGNRREVNDDLMAEAENGVRAASHPRISTVFLDELIRLRTSFTRIRRITRKLGTTCKRFSNFLKSLRSANMK